MLIGKTLSTCSQIRRLYGVDDKTAVLLLVRHGETIWNNENRVQGHADSPLSQLGIRQAQMLSSRLAKEPITTVYSSDLSRAMDTATIIAEPHNCKVIPCKELREADYGEWTGLLMNEVKTRWPDIFAQYSKDPFDVKVPGGESMRQLFERSFSKASEIAAAHQGETVLVVGHGGSVRSIAAGVLESTASIWRFKLHNAGLTIIEWGIQKPRILSLNDLSHLSQLECLENPQEERI